MHLLAQSTVTIARDAAAVYAFVADLANFGQWFPRVVAIQAENSLPPDRVGKQYRETVRLPVGRTRTVNIAVVQAEAGRTLITEGDLAPLLPRMEMTLTARPGDDGPATKLDWRMYSRSHSPLFVSLVLPLARRVVQKRADLALKTLRRILETPGESASR